MTNLKHKEIIAISIRVLPGQRAAEIPCLNLRRGRAIARCVTIEIEVVYGCDVAPFSSPELSGMCKETPGGKMSSRTSMQQMALEQSMRLRVYGLHNRSDRGMLRL